MKIICMSQRSTSSKKASSVYNGLNMGAEQVCSFPLFRVAAKKLLSRLRFPLSWPVTINFFHERPGTKFVPNLSKHLEWGATKLCVYKVVDIHRKRTH